MVYYIILILVIVGLLWVIWKSYQHNEADKRELSLLEKEKDEYAEMGKGLVEYNQKLREKKNQAKGKILEMLEKKSKISNKDVAKALDISSSSAKRYLDELEAVLHLRQVGRVGRTVYYTK